MNTKRILSVLLCCALLLALLPTVALANQDDQFTATSDGVEIQYYVLSENPAHDPGTGTVQVGNGTHPAIGSGISTVTIPDMVAHTFDDRLFNYSVTAIGDGAFRGCSNLASVTIPSSVTTIGDNAFFDCDSLQSVTIPNGVTTIEAVAFSDCNQLESVSIPGSVTSIWANSFSECANLTSLYSASFTAPEFNKEIAPALQLSSTNLDIFIPFGIETINSYAEKWGWDASAFTQKPLVTGTVKDDTGNPVAGATVTLNTSPTPMITTTNAKGEYEFFPVETGSYTVTAGKSDCLCGTASITVNNNNVLGTAITLHQPTVNGNNVYGNGAPLYISEATPDSGVPTTYVCTGNYLDEPGCTGTVTSWASKHTDDNHYIYGGCITGDLTADTAVYMKGGSVGDIYGGNEGSPDVLYTLIGNTHIEVSGGTVSGRVRGGGCYKANKTTGNVSITISGDAKVGGVYGSASGAIGGNSSVTISGGTVNGDVVGGGHSDYATVTGNSSITISGGTVKGNVIGGGYNQNTTVSGNSAVTISGGNVSGEGKIVVGGGYNAAVGTAGHSNSIKVTITGGTVEAAVYGQSNGVVNGNVEVTLSGGTVSKKICGAVSKNQVTGDVAVNVSGSFSTTGDGQISLSSTKTNRVDISGGLTGGGTQTIKLVYYGTPTVGTVVAHATNPNHADVTKFTLIDGSGTDHPLAAKANGSGGSDIVVAIPVSLTLKKDGAEWNSHGQTVELYSGSTPVATLTGSDATVTGGVVETVEYDIYVNGADTDLGMYVIVDGTNSGILNFYTVSFAANGATGTPPAAQVVPAGQKLTVPTEHTLAKTGCNIEGWYTEPACTTEWDFSTNTVTATRTLYPKWVGSDKALTAFSLGGVDGTINESAKTISVTLPYGTNVTALAATFTTSTGATVKVGETLQTSGSTINDFSNAVTYSVYSETSPSANPAVYTVTVTVEPQPATVSPNTASFDKYASAEGYADKAFEFSQGGYTLTAIRIGDKQLTLGTDYTVSGNTYTIKKETLGALAAGAHTITFDVSGGTDPTVALTVADTAVITTIAGIPLEPAAATPETTAATATVAASRLNVRSSAGKAGSILGKLQRGAAVTLYSTQDGWAKIAYNGGIGYVSLAYLEQLSLPDASITGKVICSKLNVREQPGTTGALCGQLTRGTAVDIDKVQNGWGRLAASHGALAGKWICLKYVA